MKPAIAGNRGRYALRTNHAKPWDPFAGVDFQGFERPTLLRYCGVSNPDDPDPFKFQIKVVHFITPPWAIGSLLPFLKPQICCGAGGATKPTLAYTIGAECRTETLDLVPAGWGICTDCWKVWTKVLLPLLRLANEPDPPGYIFKPLDPVRFPPLTTSLFPW